MRAVKDGIIRHYWKNNYSPNGTVVGTLTNNDCVISGFSDSNYLLVDKYPTNITSLEMYFKIKVESLGFRTIVGQKANNYKTPQLGISGSSPHYFYWNISKNGSSWVSLETNYVPNLNQYYWVKGTWNGSQIELFISEDGETFTSLGTKACTSCTWIEGIKVGDDANTSDWFDGSIDLNESYIDVNNERWWNGTHISSRTEVTSSDPYDYITTENIYKAVPATQRHYWKNIYAPNATKYGTPSENNGIASGFSLDNYYNADLININNNNFDLVAKVYGYSTSRDNPVYANKDPRGYLPKIVVRKQGTIQVSLSNSTSGWNVCDFGSTESIPSDAWVWIKVSYDGTAYTINTSLDGQVYTEIGRYATTTTYSQNLNTIGACYDTGSTGLKTGYGGQIDLTGCYLNINGERVWDGVNVTGRITATAEDYDYYTDETVYKGVNI